jgi:hypothetical protein
MTQEALKLALEALEDRVSLMKWQTARDAVKEALAQTQEPVVDAFMVHLYNVGYKSGHHDTVEGIYIDLFEQDMDTYHSDVVSEWLKETCNTAIKKALAQTQEPVAYINIEKRKLEFAHDYVKWDTPTTVKLERIPLYTTPPQRTWVGLTDEEVRDLWSWSATSEAEKTANTQQHAFARAIEAKLREKNSQHKEKNT